MLKFSIERLQPIGGDLWRAEVIVRTEETLGTREVAQVAALTVRFTIDTSSPVEELLQRAVDEARRCLALSSAYLQDRALPELLAELEPKPFQPFGAAPIAVPDAEDIG